jgi:acetolactate synthase-1/2/3 large subunit
MNRSSTKAPVLSAGAALLARLKRLGVDVVFANSGTDFPPVIEAIAEADHKGLPLPQMLVMPHEHAALGMAHGYYLMTGQPQAVMLHTNVGLANAVIGAINAACENIPMLIMSGRTPITESGYFGSRTVPIAWGQDMRDQHAMIRESCKWDYELRHAAQVVEVLDRALAIANSTPKGPVYLSLPREILCEEVTGWTVDGPALMAPATTAPDPVAISEAARWLTEAKTPLVIAQRGAGSVSTFERLAQWAEQWAMPVCSWWTTQLAISTEHPCHVGADPGPWMAEADVVLVINSLAPWWPDKHKLAPGAKVIHMGPDPIFTRFPIRNFRSDLSIAGEADLAIPALIAAMKEIKADEQVLSPRRKHLRDSSQTNRVTLRSAARRNAALGLTKAYVSTVLGEALAGLNACVFSELGTILGVLKREQHSSWFQEPHSGGLGWSFPAALGARLADPERICVATMGDGAYMFANPTVCHQIAEALDLPILVMIFNNEEWGAVRGSVMGLYPDGFAAKANRMPLTSLKPVPEFSLTAAASRAWAKRVDNAEDLPGSIANALRVVRQDRRLALLDIKVLPE